MRYVPSTKCILHIVSYLTLKTFIGDKYSYYLSIYSAQETETWRS